MRFKNMNDIMEFCKVLDQCEGSVWVENSNGAYFDMTSELSRFVAISEFIKNPDCDLEIFASDRRDEVRIMNFIVKLADKAA